MNDGELDWIVVGVVAEEISEEATVIVGEIVKDMVTQLWMEETH